MKKVLTLLTLLCMVCMGVWADEAHVITDEASALSASSILTVDQLKALAGTGKHFAFVNTNGSARGWESFGNAPNASAALSTSMLYAIEASTSATGQYWFKNFSGEYLVTPTGTITYSSTGTPFNWFITQDGSSKLQNGPAESQFRLRKDADTQANNYRVRYADFGNFGGDWAHYYAYGPFYVAHIEYQLGSTTVFEEDLIVTAGETTLTAAPAGYVFDGTPSISVSEDGTKQVAVQRDPAYVPNFPENGIYYMTIVNKDTSRDPYLYNSLQYNDDVTIQAASLPSPIANNNGYIWKVVSDGSGNITVKNGATGKGITPSGGKGGQEITSFQYTGASAGYYYLTNSEKMGGDHNRLNCADNTNDYHNEANVRAVTTWNGNHTDNEWKFENVDMTSLSEYTVEITGVESSARAYAEYNGQKALNGGFFLAATVDPNAVSAREVTDYTYEVSVNDEQKTITVNYTPASTRTPDWEGLKAILDEANTYPLGEGLGKYRYMSGEWDLTDGVFTAALESMKEDYDNREHSTTDYDGVEDYKSNLREMIDALSINQPETGKFYTFKGVQSHKYMTVTNGELKEGATEDVAANIFYVEENEDKVSILSYTTGLYVTGTSLGAVGEKAGFEFGQAHATNGSVLVGEYRIRLNGADLCSWGNGTIQGLETITQNDWEGWTIEEVEELPVNMVNVAGAYYASLYLPVAVTLPEGVKAYTGAVSGDVLTLTLVEEDVLPAWSPVILYSENAVSDHMTITTGGDPKMSALMGTISAVSAAEGQVGEGAYVLNKSGDNVGFYKTTTKINGFKAYLPADAVASGVQKFSFNFNEKMTTAIRAIESENSGAEIFDAAGNHLKKAQKGMNIINGHKVIVK